MAHEWKIGDWLEWSGTRYLVINAYETAGASRIDVVGKGRSAANELGVVTRLATGSLFTHLPGCDSWDWEPPKPIEPPPGYRLLVEGETIGEHDLSYANKQWMPVHSISIGQSYKQDTFFEMARKIAPPEGYELIREGGFVAKGDLCLAKDGNWHECLMAGTSMTGDGAKAYAQKIEPQYRPFANAAEYEPFAEKWISRSEMGVVSPGAWRPIGYSDIGIYPDSMVMEYADAFKVLKFKDGAPFGVPVNVGA